MDIFEKTLHSLSEYRVSFLRKFFIRKTLSSIEGIIRHSPKS